MPDPKWIDKFELKPGTWIFVPSEESRRSGRKIKRLLESRWANPDYYYHLREGGHVQAMKSHTSGKYFLHLDLRQFFSSINRSRITRSLKVRLGYKNAREIAKVSTVPGQTPDSSAFVLPFGFVQSPVLASICLRHSKLGKTLHALSKKTQTKVSVYVDDIIISTQSAEEAQDALTEVKAAAKRSRFPLNADKEEGPAEQITAFNIKLSFSSLTLSEERLSQFLKAYRESDSQRKKEGILGYIESVNSGQSAYFL
ncbi:reverse transcriptase domain-containing protein [Endozoicomonas gorgoniicola]|uniref:Reverse transcriptase domain-containing protein n=1 Tax=Endozoicomonas gorgoniicola TaxID=1234144 RepID=A0ABT3N235_9GAMM|nr:reverse transcriptase domain-containing protein [Endozoicomonas gorgoniicola]MCW7555698.1 reverse transcriptase domain-containing protein [Endozoicomonas gorgoniicola]